VKIEADDQKAVEVGEFMTKVEEPDDDFVPKNRSIS
jgi:hypothetical protein